MTIDGEERSAVTLDVTGNKLLKPERTTEYEIGLDAGLFENRIALHYTYFTKTSKDALIERELPPSLGLTQTVFENLGEVKNSGHEISVNLAVVEMQDVGLDLNVTASFFDNEIVDLGEGTQDIIFGFRGTQRHQAGRAAGSFFQPEIFFNDADGNGKLTNDEVTVGDTAIFLGESLPTWQTSVNLNLRIFDWINVSTLFEGRGGNKSFDFTESFKCGFRSTRGCAAVSDPNSPLEEQARYIAARFHGSNAGYAQDADFIRWRELSITLTAPPSVTRSVPSLDGLSLTLAGRNLNIWTDYEGFDPEINTGGGNQNFNQAEFNTQPPVRSLLLRLNYTF